MVIHKEGVPLEVNLNESGVDELFKDSHPTLLLIRTIQEFEAARVEGFNPDPEVWAKTWGNNYPALNLAAAYLFQVLTEMATQNKTLVDSEGSRQQIASPMQENERLRARWLERQQEIDNYLSNVGHRQRPDAAQATEVVT